MRSARTASAALSLAANLLTVALKGNNGADPSNSNPVLIPFRDPTVANGGPVWRAITGALSINTNATGATLGSANGVPFRLWVLAFDNAGTVVLALWQSVTGGASPIAIAPLNEAATQNTTGMSGAATSAATFYTPNGTALTGKPFRILGYLDYASGLTTAGTYASAPTTVQLFGPGIKKPGDPVQLGTAVNTGTQSTTSATYATMSGSVALSFAPSMSPNVVKVTMTSQMVGTLAGTIDCSVRVFNSTTSLQVGYSTSSQLTSNNNWVPCIAGGYDRPGSTSAQSYIAQGQINGGGTLTLGNGFSSGGAMLLEAQEIMV